MYKTRSTRGMALIAVLWLVAAMSLIVTGVVKTVRTEAAGTGLQRQMVIGSALADAAVLLALQQLHDKGVAPGEAPESIAVTFAEHSMSVQLFPLNGLIDLNNAPIQLLVDLYRYAGELDQTAAQNLAQATIAARQSKNSKGLTVGFDAPEDLFRLPGFTYALYAKISSLVTADLSGGSGRVNPLAAPYGVLLVLSGGDASKASLLLSQRSSKSSFTDTSFLKPDLIEMGPSSSIKLQTSVPMPFGSVFKEWIVSALPDPVTALPWRTVYVSQPVAKLAKSED